MDAIKKTEDYRTKSSQPPISGAFALKTLEHCIPLSLAQELSYFSICVVCHEHDSFYRARNDRSSTGIPVCCDVAASIESSITIDTLDARLEFVIIKMNAALLSFVMKEQVNCALESLSPLIDIPLSSP